MQITPKFEPAEHQKIGTNHLIDNKYFALFDEAGTGKTKQVIDAADKLNYRGDIDTLLVVAPAQCRSVWSDPNGGELAKHSVSPIDVYTIGGARCAWRTDGDASLPRLRVVITSYETVRLDRRLNEVLECISGCKVWLIFDESHCVKSHKSLQSKMALNLRRRHEVYRCTIMTGSPNDNSIMDLYQQFKILEPGIIGCASHAAFRERYARCSGNWSQVIGYKDLAGLMARVKPYILQRREEDVTDLPGIDKQVVRAPLDKSAWRIYKDMENGLVAALDAAAADSPFAFAQNAAVATTRLLQICAGFIPAEFEDNKSVEIVSSAKLDAALKWAHDNAYEQGELTRGKPRRLLIWTRFRFELDRLVAQLEHDYEVVTIEGGQSAANRQLAVDAMMDHSTPARPVICVANAQAGRQGLNLTGCSRILYVSQDFSLTTAYQSEKRTYRRGQTKKTYYTTVVATGPAGQSTVDTSVQVALKSKRDIRSMTIREFRKAVLSR